MGYDRKAEFTRALLTPAPEPCQDHSPNPPSGRVVGRGNGERMTVLVLRTCQSRAREVARERGGHVDERLLNSKPATQTVRGELVLQPRARERSTVFQRATALLGGRVKGTSWKTDADGFERQPLLADTCRGGNAHGGMLTVQQHGLVVLPGCMGGCFKSRRVRRE